MSLDFFCFFFRRERFSESKYSKKKSKTGGFEKESDAARAYDVAALACRGHKRALTNFPAEEYLEEIAALAEAGGVPQATSGSTASTSTAPPSLSLEALPLLPHDLVVAHVRRRSTAFARGRYPFRGVSGEDGRWEARIGGLFGRKNVRRKRSFSFQVFFFFFSLQLSQLKSNCDLSQKNVNNQVSLGVHGSEEDAARAYDRALILEKGEFVTVS